MSTRSGSLIRKLAAASKCRKSILARHAGVSSSLFSRLLSGNVDPTIEQCLRLALVFHTSASTLLRAAGKSDVADDIERCYGAPVDHPHDDGPHLSPDVLDTAATLQVLDEDGRRAVKVIVDAMAAATKSGRGVKETNRRVHTETATSHDKNQVSRVS